MRKHMIWTAERHGFNREHFIAGFDEWTAARDYLTDSLIDSDIGGAGNAPIQAALYDCMSETAFDMTLNTGIRYRLQRRRMSTAELDYVGGVW